MPHLQLLSNEFLYVNGKTWQVLCCFKEKRTLLEGSEHSLRSRRLEVVGERENGYARGSHTPVFSYAHYFQAPATQAKVSLALTLFKVMFNTINTN